MQISEMLQLTDWIKLEIESAGILAKFDALYNILNGNVRRPNNQPVQSFEDQKIDLINAVSSININILSLSQIEGLEVFHIKPNIGALGRKRLEELFNNMLDIAHIAEQVDAIKNEIQSGITSSNQIGTALEPFLETEEMEIGPNKVLTRVIFKDEASVGDIKNLNDWSSKWFTIGRGFAMANGQTPEDIQVVGGARGSLIIELAVLATTAVPLAKALNLTLDSMVKYRDYQLRAAEVRKMKSETPKLKQEFEEDAKRWEQRAQQLKEETAEDIAKKIVKHFSNYQKENQAELEKAVRTLVDFITKGGDVDCVIAEEGEEEEGTGEIDKAIKLLRKDFGRIRELKETLLLEHKKDDSGGD